MSSSVESVMKEIKALIQPGGKAYKEYAEKVDAIMLGTIKVSSGTTLHTPEDAAAKFIEVLSKSIESSGLSANAQDAISKFGYTTPLKMSDGTYLISVYFATDLSRPSLYSEKYEEGLKDLAEMLNDGMSAKDHVYGTWHGKKIRSKTTFPGTYFMEQAVRDFLGNYGADYNVISCTLNRD